MKAYKRNQLEEAVSKVFEPDSGKPSQELRIRIKRLLETDRALEGEPDGSGIKPFAFFSEGSPGSGREIWFSAYEVFAVLVGLHLMDHGWTQSFAVKIVRRVRDELEVAYSITLTKNPKELFDKQAIRAAAQPGDLVSDNLDPFFLTIVSARGANANVTNEPVACGVKRGQGRAYEFAQQCQSTGGGAFTMFDVVGSAHAINAALAQTKPQARGRG